MASLRSAMHEDLYLEVVEPVAKVFQETSAAEWEQVREYVQLSLAMIAQRTLDEDVRVRWFRGPIGKELSALAGSFEAAVADGGSDGDGHGAGLDDADTALLRGLIQGRTNQEIAEEMGLDETAVVRRLGELFARIGASSRAEATAFAFRERVV
jgi:DNA-binding NarL/FixJ family response regulator